MVWYLECTPAITSHLQNGSAFAFLHLLNTILGLWIFNACSKYFVTECEWFGFCHWTSPCVGVFAPWIYFLCPNTRDILNMRDWIAPSSGRLSVCNTAFAVFFLWHTWLQCPPLILAPLINMSKGGCENKSALFILLIFHSKNSQNSNLSLK